MDAPESHDDQALTWALLTVFTSLGIISLLFTSNNAFGVIWTSTGAAGLLGAAATRWRTATPPSSAVPWACFLFGGLASFAVLMVANT